MPIVRRHYRGSPLHVSGWVLPAVSQHDTIPDPPQSEHGTQDVEYPSLRKAGNFTSVITIPRNSLSRHVGHRAIQCSMRKGEPPASVVHRLSGGSTRLAGAGG